MAQIVGKWTNFFPVRHLGLSLALVCGCWITPSMAQLPSIAGGIPSIAGGMPSLTGGTAAPTPCTTPSWAIRPGYIGYTPKQCVTPPRYPIYNPQPFYVGGVSYSAPVQPSTVIVQPAAGPVSTSLPMSYNLSVREMLYVPSASGNGRVGIETIGSSATSSPTFASVSTTAPKLVEPTPISPAILNRLSTDTGAKELLALATHEDPRVQVRAKQTLAAQGDAAVPVLMEALVSNRASLSSAAGDVLAELGPSSVPQLLELLKPESPLEVRIKAAHTLGKLGAHAEAAAPVMAEMLKRETNRDLRFYLLTALAKINQ